MLITPHFSSDEADCHDGTPVPVPLEKNIERLCGQLEIIRTAVGQFLGKETPITVDDMYRTPAHNKAVDGEPHSQHLLGKAADIRVTGMTALQLHTLIEAEIKAGRLHDGGLGLYKTFVHYDIRDKHARWSAV